MNYMPDSRKNVIELHDVAIYHNINPFKELTHRNCNTNGELVLNNLSLRIGAGEFVYLIGRVGSGKSSLIKVLYGELPLLKGSGNVVGFNLRSLKQREIPILRRNIGVVFQEFQALSEYNVFENLAFVLRNTDWKEKRQIETRIDEVLTQVGLNNMHHKMPFELSGGERQRLMIARALLNTPQLILADEPTGNLDPVTAESIVRLFHSIAASGTTVLMATHNTSFVDDFPARTLLFSQGVVKEVDFNEF